MKKIIFGLLFFIGSCEAQPPIAQPKLGQQECEISFLHFGECQYQQGAYHITVKIQAEALAEDEVLLKNLLVQVSGVEQLLAVSADTTMLEGDVGYLSFADINFDGAPDLAITTSFGTPNLYMDYWVFDRQKSNYISLGNYPVFVLDPQAKTLSATIKNNAASYETLVWHWVNGQLKER